MIPFSIVVAMDEKRGIGQGNKLPWHLPGELKHFRELTARTQNPLKKNIVIMGRKTWESLPEKFRPLPDRINVVLSSNDQLKLPKDCILVDSFMSLFELFHQPEWKDRYESVFVIGGASVYKQAINLVNCRTLYITQVSGVYSCDAFFPDFSHDFQKVHESSRQKEGSIEYFYSEYRKKTLS